MAIAIIPYTEDRIPAVQAFNQRLAVGGVAPEFHFPDNNIPRWLPHVDGRRIYQQFYLAVEEDVVRGAYILKSQDFWLHGERKRLVYYHLPISEGIVNKSYSSVGVHMLRSALKAEPALFCLGMGGFDGPLPRMLRAVGWGMSAVPLYFQVHHPERFLRNLTPLRQSASRRFLSDAAASTGIGRFGIKTVQWIRSRAADQGEIAELVRNFGVWADDLWQKCSQHYTLIAARDSATLNILYPEGKSFLCLQVRRGTDIVGWAVLLDTQMRGNKYFGDMRLGSIVDCLALPENAPAVVKKATRFLHDRGVDLVVSNHSHTGWCVAFEANGFLRGPSNFIFAASKPVLEWLAPFEANQNQIYFTRGDGDGPVNL